MRKFFLLAMVFAIFLFSCGDDGSSSDDSGEENNGPDDDVTDDDTGGDDDIADFPDEVRYFRQFGEHVVHWPVP